MKNNTKAHLFKRWLLVIPILVSAMMCVSCREDYFYDEQEPEWLGESIYDFLVEEGKYSYYVRLINDLGYKDVLQRTGSKTLFVVDDEAFNEFLGSNEWGVSSYEQLTTLQKEQILYASMLNNVFFTDMLGDASGAQKGTSMRRTSALSVASTRKMMYKEDFPDTYYWGLIKSDSIILLQDNTSAPMVAFTNSYLVNNSLKGSDYAFISKQPSGYIYKPTDVFINGVRIEESNMKCKNGVVHRLGRLVTPLTNMAEIVCSNESTQRFGELLDRFSAPFPSTSATIEYGNVTPVYVKKYFTSRGHSAGLDGFNAASNVSFMTTPTDSAVEAGLKFDPGWNRLTASDVKPMNEDMAAMFVPTTAALDTFLQSGSGKFLYDKYKGWDGIPLHVLADLLNNHMKSSFANTVPSKFDQVKNDAQIDMGVEDSHICDAILCSNGVVYITDHVYAPVSYVSVTAPTLVNDNMNVMRWATEKYGFLAYLHSMDSYYSFLLPTDENLWYLDPLSVAKGEPEYWKFLYNSDEKSVEVHVYDSLKATRVRTLQAWRGDANLIENRLADLIDQHIIVDDIDAAAEGVYYYRTKGNGTVKVKPNTAAAGLNIYAGYQLETDSVIVVPDARMYPSNNGKTYVLSSFAQPSLKSVYEAMQEQAGDGQDDPTAPFYQFFKLMLESGVFAKDDTYATSGEYTVDVFNTYHYTIYVPSNEAVLKAIEDGLPTMEQANAYLNSLGKTLTNAEKELYLNKISDIIRDFVCYHIHDNSVYVGGAKVEAREYQTSTLDMDANLFRRVTVSADSESLTVVDAAQNTHHVSVLPDKEGVAYNIMTRDYLFNDGKSGISMDSETQTSKETDIKNCTQIETSSFAVIHALDGVLLYDEGQLEGYKEDVANAQREFEESIK